MAFGFMNNLAQKVQQVFPSSSVAEQIHYEQPFKVDVDLERKIEYHLADNSQIAVIYLDIIGFSDLEKSFCPAICKRVLHCFSQSISDLANNDHLDKGRVIAFHKMADDDFVIYYINTEELANEKQLQCLREEVLDVRCIAEKLLNSEVSGWFPQTINLRVGFTTISLPVEQNFGNRIYSSIKEAIKVAEAPNLDLMESLQELRGIIKGRDIRSVYQPIVSLNTGEIYGYEALSRGPEGGRFYHPDDMFPFAEETGNLYRLERLCREQAISNFTALKLQQKLFLNINPQVINDPEFTSGITVELLKRIGITPQDVIFEITERTSIKDFRSFKKALEHYREQGFLIAIDDAGAGYSSLQAIAELKPDFIKVDMSLIRYIDRDTVKQALLETFLLFAQKIKAKVVAEGIERAEELEKIVQIGVEYGQGFLLGKPAFPAPDIDPVVKMFLLES